MPRRWDENQDQVVRRDHFVNSHPGVKIRFQGEAGIWEATYAGNDGATRTASAFELGELLNILEKVFRSDPG